jgi:predicted small lipoprotein YifL
MKHIDKSKKILSAVLALALMMSMAACGAQNTVSLNGDQDGTEEQTEAAETETAEGTETGAESENTAETETAVNTGSAYEGAIDTSDLFTERDLAQSADLSEAEYITVTDGQDVEITAEGVYVISGKASEVTIRVDAGDEDKVQLVLDGADITNESTPVIYVVNADKVFVTTTDSTSTLKVTGEFTADGDTNTDAVIFSKDDLVLNGTGTLKIVSTDNGITSKDDLKITGGTIDIEAQSDAIEANDSIAVCDGSITIITGKDGFHAENDDDDSLGYIYISGGTFDITAEDDGIQATTVLQIDGGTFGISAAEGLEGTQVVINNGKIVISATDDGINGSQKSTALSIKVEINGGDIEVSMGQGDTDAIDVNGDLSITGGTINITAQSPFDVDGTVSFTGGTVIENGQEVSQISSQMMGGGMNGGPGGQMQGGFGGGQMQGGPGGSGGPMGGGPGQQG